MRADRRTDKQTYSSQYVTVNGLQGSYPGMMKSAVNSIVCTEGNNLLVEMFNVTPSTVRPVSFPPRHCKTAAARCDLCLERDECLLTGQRLFLFFIAAHLLPLVATKGLFTLDRDPRVRT